MRPISAPPLSSSPACEAPTRPKRLEPFAENDVASQESPEYLPFPMRCCQSLVILHRQHPEHPLARISKWNPSSGSPFEQVPFARRTYQRAASVLRADFRQATKNPEPAGNRLGAKQSGWSPNGLSKTNSSDRPELEGRSLWPNITPVELRKNILRLLYEGNSIALDYPVKHRPARISDEQLNAAGKAAGK